ncbi:helix-turn-helix domain-containing protein [Serratia sp. NPDC087055]|uniref:helix-turn-helix domain-containing protein n=1 Tax=Serratia sp. NPDC087055 TaxID=3364516 RepID=UPI003851623C
MSVQFLKDSNDNVAYAVIPIDDYRRLIAAAGNEDDDAFEDVPYSADSNDDDVIPHAVVSIKVKEGVSLLAAWRIYRNLSQADVAAKLSVTQASVSQLESSKRPQAATLAKLAEIYNCTPAQLR